MKKPFKQYWMQRGWKASYVLENLKQKGYNKQKPQHLLLALSVIVFLNSCYKQGQKINPNKVLAADSVTEENVTYDNYIHDVLKNNCSTCHGPKGSAETWWLNDNTYENAVRYSGPITATMINGTMPPPPKFPFYEKDRKLLAAWIHRGMPKNN